MATTTPQLGDSESVEANAGKAGRKFFHWTITVVTLAMLFATLRDGSSATLGELAAWAAASLIADLMYVRVGNGITLSMSLPVLLAAGMTLEPSAVALVAFIGCLDPLEIRGRSCLERILFNRSQVALSAAAASLAMHTISVAPLTWPTVLAVSIVGLTVDSLVNVLLVAMSAILRGVRGWREVVAGLWGVEPRASAGLYVSMACMAPLVALVFASWGAWGLLTCFVILVPIRVALTKIQTLGVAARTVRLREAELEEVESLSAFARRDERLIMAGDLHDEVLPALFRVHLMGEVLKQDLEMGRLLALDDDVPELLDATRAAQAATRSVIRELRSGRAGVVHLVRAIRSVAEQLEEAGRPSFELRLCEVPASEVARRALFQIAREAMTNGSRYSGAERVLVQLAEGPGQTAELLIRDDGVGFDAAAIDGSEHFGLMLMRERAAALGGCVDVTSRRGQGTTVLARIPLA